MKLLQLPLALLLIASTASAVVVNRQGESCQDIKECDVFKDCVDNYPYDFEVWCFSHIDLCRTSMMSAEPRLSTKILIVCRNV